MTPQRRAPARGRPKGQGSTVVYQRLRERILNLSLAPGSDLDEDALVREFGFSRTPVREALIRLASDGFIALLPNRGARVASLNVNDVPALLEALELCERAVNRWAALRRSDADLEQMQRLSDEFREAAAAHDMDRMSIANGEFHKTLAESCGNRHIAKLHDSLVTQTVRLARLAFGSLNTNDSARREYYDDVVRQHDEMVEAIRDRDADRADALACAHADIFRSHVHDFIRNSFARNVPLGKTAADRKAIGV